MTTNSFLLVGCLGLFTAGCSVEARIARESGNQDAGAASGSGGGPGSTSGNNSTSSSGLGGTGGIESNTGGTGACVGYVGLATPEEIALTPRTYAEAEILAIEATGAFVAPSDVYNRIVVDLSVIRGTHPEITGIAAMPSWAPEDLLINFDGVGEAAVENGTYTAWDCPNELYGLSHIEDLSIFAHLTFGGRFHADLLAAEYAELPNVTLSSPNHIGGDGDDVCVAIKDDTYLYIFDHGWGDCPAGCTGHQYWGYQTVSGDAIFPLGTWSHWDEILPDADPAWLAFLESCKAWL